jgi:hypothetical protein
MRRKLALVVAAAAALWLAPGALAAGWCGSGESTGDRPDVVTAQQVHAVYAYPSDGTDNFATVANKLADDVASITAWWITQDSTRTPRFDQATFPGGTCLDISAVRLPRPASAYTGASAAFDAVSRDLFNAGLSNEFKKYYVYYDGPSVAADICGTGGGDFATGPNYAVVWLQGCPGVPTDATGAHELAHAFGAVPAGAPHECPPPNGGHVCDSQQDLLYPFTVGDPLTSLVLDVNHDDYYEHATNGIDIRNSLWLRHLDTPEVPLTVGISGTGHVTSEEPGVDCTATCTTQWDQGWQVQLQAVDTSTTRFVSWRGACTGRTSTCDVSLDAAASATAVFGPLKIPVRVSVGGRGSVTCTPRCSRTFVAGDPLTLRAVAARGWRFARWTGACTGTRPVCRPATDYAVTARAVFTRRR